MAELIIYYLHADTYRHYRQRPSTHRIAVYNFPYDVEEDDEETIQDNSELRVCCVFVVAGLQDLT